MLDVTSEVRPLDRLTLTVIAPNGAIVLDQEVSHTLPGHIHLDSGSRAERELVIAWGWQAGARVAYASAALDVAPGLDREVALALAAPPPDCDGDNIPDVDDRCPRIADPSQEDGDADGTSDACVPGASCPGNLVTNPDFEQGTTGWHPIAGKALLTQVAGGHSGTFAGRVCKDPGNTTSLYDIVDQPQLVPQVTVGATYRLDAWIRTSTSVAQNIDLSLKEFSGTTLVGEDAGSTFVPTGDWQLGTTSYTATTAGAFLDIRLQGENSAAGACFDADDLCIVIEHTCP